MSSHRRTDSISSAVFVPHPLNFAGVVNDEEKISAAKRYDWQNTPAKLLEPKPPYEPTQPFDYVLPKKTKAKALSLNNGVEGGGEVVVKRKVGRPRKDAQENHAPHVGIEPDGLERAVPKRRGRPPRRAAEVRPRIDDGDDSEDESYVQPNESSWRAGTKRRASAPHHPSKRTRISRTEGSDEEEAGNLRSGGARSRATPIKPQQANRWSATEDRQLIDSLFEVIGSIPWRQITNFMAQKGYPCADRGEGAIRGRWKVLRTRLYIAPPPVVRGAAAKSQLKAREREEQDQTTREEVDEEEDMDADHGESSLLAEPVNPEHDPEQDKSTSEFGPATDGGGIEQAVGDGDTTAEDEDIAAHEEAAARKREQAARNLAAKKIAVPSAPFQNLVDTPPLSPNLSTLPSALPPISVPQRASTPSPPHSQLPRSPLAFTPPRQSFQHSTPNPNVSTESHTYSHLSPASQYNPPTLDSRTLFAPSARSSPNVSQRHPSPPTSPSKLPALPQLASQMLSSPPPGRYSPTHPPLSVSHQTSVETRHLPLPQPFVPHRSESAWPTRYSERRYHTSGERGAYPQRSYVPPPADYGATRYEREPEPEKRTRKPEMSSFPLHQERYMPPLSFPTSPSRESFQTASSSYQPAQFQPLPAQNSFQPPPAHMGFPYSQLPSSSSPFTTSELAPGHSRLPVLADRTPSPRRKHRQQPSRKATSSQSTTEVPDSTAGSSDGGR